MKRTQYYIKSFAGVLFFLIILFISAGRVDYYQGWLFTAVSFFGMVLNFVLLRNDAELLEERSHLQQDAKEWDKRIIKLSALITIMAYIVAGMDSGRYQWSGLDHWGYSLAGGALIVGGQLLFLAAKRANTFFSSIVRIQKERGHTVCETGPYQYVRHPGYLGMIVSWVGFPILLESLWSAIPVGIAIILLLIRTRLEDKTLLDELSGYSSYINKVRYMLLPGIW